MADKPSHLQEVPQGASYADVAQATDETVRAIMQAQLANHPGHAGAVLAGALSAATRYQIQRMPSDTAAFQVLQVMAPIVQNVAGQLVKARAEREGRKVPTLSPANPQQSAFERLQAQLAQAPIPSFVLWTDQTLVLVSLDIEPGRVRSHATPVDVASTMADPAREVEQHCIAALAVWNMQGQHAGSREAMGTRLNEIIRGHDLQTALEAVCDTLAYVAAAIAPTATDAKGLLADLVPDIQEAVQAQWDHLTANKEKPDAG